MKVPKESPKEQKVLLLQLCSMRNPGTIGVSVLQNTVSTGAIESKSLTEDLGAKVSPHSRQHSMRKSRVSGELERDAALSSIQCSSKFPSPTPLNPKTPLRWKSTKRIESEKRKLQEEIKTKEVVKEEKKNVNLAKEERKDECKLAPESAGVNGIETLHKFDTLPSNHFASQDGERLTSSASTSESGGPPPFEKAEGPKLSHPVPSGRSSEHAKPFEEVSWFNQGTNQAAGENSGTDRKPLTGDDSTAITIDFLRARLLAERASSKAARERIQQLTQKVQELEGRLDQEIQSSRKAEEAAREALMKVESLKESKASSPGKQEVSCQHGGTKTDQVQELGQADGKCEEPAHMDDTKLDATAIIKPGHIQSALLEINEIEVNEIKAIPTSGPASAGHDGVQSSDKNGAPNVEQDGIPMARSIACKNGDTNSSTNAEFEKREMRFSTADRLHCMWNQMAVEVGALAKDSTVEDHVREGLLKWMHQFPRVVQDVVPKPSEEKRLVIETKTKNMLQKGGPPEIVDSGQALNSEEDSSERPVDVAVINAPETMEQLSLDEASCGDGSSTISKSLRKVASLIEKFEANESIQREWENSNSRQTSASRRRSREGSLSRTNSNPGTPSSIETLETHRQEDPAGEHPKPSLQVGGSKRNSLASDSSVSPHEGATPESLLTWKDKIGRTGTFTPGDSTPSTYPNSPIFGDVARRSGKDGIIPSITAGTRGPSLVHTEFGLQGSLDTSFGTPLLSPSSGPRIGERRGDSTTAEDRSQLFRQSHHPRALNGHCMTPGSHSERSSEETGEPGKSQALIGWVNLEDAHSTPVSTNTGDHSTLQCDASIQGRHLHRERFGPDSQAGNSNAYIRPDHYPVRNDEREIYRGRMESVSRSMEGLGSSWRSLSDGEGDETQLFADVPDAMASSTSGRSGPEMAFQASGDSGWSSYRQPENIEGTHPRFAHPGQEFPRDDIRNHSASSKIESSASKVNEVLKALQLAKMSIQNSGTRRSTISNPCLPASERSYAEGDRRNRRTDCGFSDGRLTIETPAALRGWSHPEITRRYSTGALGGAGPPSHLQPSKSAPYGMLSDAHRKYPEDKHLTGRS